MSNWPKDVKPNLFIIGAPKCGTTSLAAWLGDHPQIHMCPIKEPHFFNTDHRTFGRLTLREYEDLFAPISETCSVIGEASVWYFASECAVENILDYNPESKFIVCLRNPVEMAPALHNQQLANGNEPLNSFEEAWYAQSNGAIRTGIPRHVDPFHLSYGPACKLGEQFRRLKKRVAFQNIQAVILDDIADHPRRVYDDLLTFLDVKPHATEFAVLNASYRRRNNRIYRITKKLGRLKRSLGSRTSFGILSRLERWNRIPHRRPPLDAKMRQVLVEYFADDVELLSEQLNRDLSHWLLGPDNTCKGNL